ncbi:MAG: thioredoxin family protein [Filimonas sp.]|nr:thioredoxin family protein [Filimonas sp.]
MKKYAFLVVAAFAFTISAVAQNIQSIAIGTALPATNVKLKDISGKDVTLDDAKQKNGLLVMFSCNTCPYVVKNQQRTKEICAYAQKNGLGVILLNSNEGQRDGADSYEAMKEYAAKQGYQWMYAVDKNSTIANVFGASRTPEVYLFNKDGKLAYKGAIDDNPSDAANAKQPHLKAAIDQVVAGKDVTVKESRSVGCGIKRPA